MIRRRWLIGCLIPALLAGFGLAGWITFVSVCMPPRDQVTVIIEPLLLPENTKLRALVVDHHGQFHAMRCYDMMMGGLSRNGDINTVVGSGGDAKRTAIVMWEFGNRYGVLIQKITYKEWIKGEPNVPFDENWRILWFNAADVPIEGRSFFTGGGKVAFDLSRGQSEPLSKEEAEKLRTTP
jgi:hypothetical protein